MKKIFLLILFGLILNCKQKKEIQTEDVIKTESLEIISDQKEIVKNKILVLSEEINQLDEALSLLDTTPLNNFPLVTAHRVESSEFSHYVEVQGNIQTRKNINIHPELAGVLKKIKVSEGEKVVKGQLLALIDDSGLSDQLEQAKIQLKLVKLIYKKQKRLWKKKIGSEIEYLQAKTQFQIQEKVIEQLEKQLKKANIYAPFSGIIDEIMVNEGANLNPQFPVFRLINLDIMYADADIPENYIQTITKNKKVSVYTPVLDTLMESEISQVGNFIDPENRTFRVEIQLSNEDNMLKPNMNTRIKINDYKNPNAILIPKQIYAEDASGKKYVYKLLRDNNKKNFIISKKYIKTGKSDSENIEVISGLKANDLLVLDGFKMLDDKQKVSVRNLHEITTLESDLDVNQISEVSTYYMIRLLYSSWNVDVDLTEFDKSDDLGLVFNYTISDNILYVTLNESKNRKSNIKFDRAGCFYFAINEKLYKIPVRNKHLIGYQGDEPEKPYVFENNKDYQNVKFKLEF